MRFPTPRGARPGLLALFATAAVLAAPPGAFAQQRSAENALASSDDAFGSVVGNERTGIYGDNEVRGFSPIRAGNIRVEGVYFDQQTFIATRARAGSRIRVGIAALDYPFPAPTGIVDIQLRQATAKPSASIQVAQNFYDGQLLELDLRGSIVPDKLTITGGVSIQNNRDVDGSGMTNWGAGAVPRLKLHRGEVTVILGHFGTRRNRSRPLISTPSPFLPPLLRPGNYIGQDWAKGSAENSNFGAIWRQAIGSSWSLRSGAFFSRQLVHRHYTEIFVVSDPMGAARHTITADAPRRLQSYSGEAQLTWAHDTERLKNRLLFTVRARDKLAESGGADTRDLGPVRLGDKDPEPRTEFTFRGIDQNKIRQVTGAVGYMGRWVGVGQFNIGLQKTDYRQTFTKFGAATGDTIEDSPWLYNATLVLAPGTRWLAYGSYVKGLEESGIAPENATNRNETLPPSRTTQYEAGVRGKLYGMTLAASAFQIQKPYFTLDPGNRFTDLGEVRHRGLEASLSGVIAKRLNLLVGGLLMRPQVVGEARALGRVGERPVGVASVVGRVDAEYQTGFKGLSLTLAALYNGKRAASARPYAELGGKQLFAPGFTAVDLGLRYRFTARKTPMTARVILANVLDNRSWGVAQSNAYRLNDSRRLAVFLSADF